MRKLKNYKPTKFKAKGSYYDKEYADLSKYKDSMRPLIAKDMEETERLLTK